MGSICTEYEHMLVSRVLREYSRTADCHKPALEAGKALATANVVRRVRSATVHHSPVSAELAEVAPTRLSDARMPEKGTLRLPSKRHRRVV
jgi:hypothetical protein